LSEWYFSLYWGVAAMLLPFYVRFNPFNDVRICKNFAFFAAFCVSFFIFGIGNNKIDVKTKITIILLSILSWFNHTNFYSGAAIEQTVIFNVFLLFLYQLLSHKLDIKIICACIRYSAIAQALLIFSQLTTFNVYNWSVPMLAPVGALGQQTLSGALLSVSIATFFVPFWWIFTPLIIMAIIISGSAMSLMSLFTSIYVFLFRKFIKSMWFYIIPTVVALIAYLAFKNSLFLADNMRYELWSTYLSKLSMLPITRVIFGNGFGNFWDTCSLDVGGQRFSYFHNEALEIVWALGAIGTSSFFYLLFKALHFKRTDDAFICFSILISALLNSLGNFTFHISSIAIIILIAYSYLVTNDSRKELI
jgi:hypothetical protein